MDAASGGDGRYEHQQCRSGRLKIKNNIAINIVKSYYSTQVHDYNFKVIIMTMKTSLSLKE